MTDALSFAERVVRWQRQQGRHQLPWQNPRTPYRVWISEIMLQQTQVQTVVSYFNAFMHRFPDVRQLAQASEDDVLSAWSGLGYYSRARNLHRCAQDVVQLWGGELPTRSEDLERLPGIGPSTAAAIAALCHGERISIMDGNVQRVLTRWLAHADDLILASSRKALQTQAQALLPTDAQSMQPYTQGLMDLGALVCKPKQPDCEACPLGSDCQARRLGKPLDYPVKTRKLTRRSESWWLLLMQTRQGQLGLVQRPAAGVWARLWSLPMFASESAAMATLPNACLPHLAWQPPLKHVLTHRDWWLNVGVVSLSQPLDMGGLVWLDPDQALQRALPQPIRACIQGWQARAKS
ncbi:MAG: A/G-specific adenine glycosylase [Betaproteobacteria bacterium]|jgi:A/G-specific adenine glycosylase|nr:A/G-specific adenine glycosylase [Betaproteobacteria bacterium]NBP45506.1 A/G-specific adenine glycosylase [Betaproteobacteria bacterium]